jgi:hypothetical protein
VVSLFFVGCAGGTITYTEPLPPSDFCGTFWEHENKGGREDRACGDLFVIFEDDNDSISSYEIDPGSECLVAEHEEFGGEVMVLTGSDNIPAYLNDKISAIRCMPAGEYDSSIDSQGIMIYEHDHYAGESYFISLSKNAGGIVEEIPPDWNDRISSVKVGVDLKFNCAFFEHGDEKGNGYPVSSGQKIPRLGEDWNDKVSSLKCVQLTPTPNN